MKNRLEKREAASNSASANVVVAEDAVAVTVRDDWISNAQSTKPLDSFGREAVLKTIRELYRLSKWKVPPDLRMVFVPSPLVLVVAAGLSTVYWASRKTTRTIPRATKDDDLLRSFRKYAPNDVGNALQFEVYEPVARCCRKLMSMIKVPVDVGIGLVGDAIEAGGPMASVLTSGVGSSASRSVVRAAVLDACRSSTGDDFFDYNPKDVVDDLGLEEIVDKIGKTMDAVQLGNLSGGVLAAIDYLVRRDVVVRDNLLLLMEMGSLAGPWVMHPEFCIVCDRPEVLNVNENGQLHSEKGPACRWRDGTRIYSLRGVHVGSKVVEAPESMTVSHLEKMSTEQRNACFDLAPKREQVIFAIHDMEDEES